MPKTQTLASRLMAGTALGLVFAGPALGQARTQTKNKSVEQVIIRGHYDFKIDTPSLDKLTQPLLDTPQSIATVSAAELKDQAVSNLNDALRTIPGVTLGAGEFSWQGNSPTIRGFVARTDMFLDGMRDFGNYYRDAFNLERIEVLEGPSSIYFGRGSTGGVINQVSKQPQLEPLLSATVAGGTDDTRRATVDIDRPVPELGQGAAFRLNAMAQDANVAGRDQAENRRYGLAPSLALGLGTPTRLTVDYFHQSENDRPDYGLPWYFGRPAPVSRRNFYGFSSDFLNTDADIVTLGIEHDLNDNVTLRNRLRYAHYTRDFRITEAVLPSSATPSTPLSAIMLDRNIWSGNSVETQLIDQADAVTEFTTAGVQHNLVAGLELARESSAPEYDNSTGVPTVSLTQPNPNVPFNAANTYKRLKADTVGKSAAVYAIDTLEFSPQWELTAGLRWDRFDADYHSTSYSPTSGAVTATNHIPRVDEMTSYRAALVYKPRANASIYAAVGTSFDPSAEALSQITSGRGLGTGNAKLAPEKNRSYEVGSKWDLLHDRLSVAGSVFRLEKLNARVPDPSNPGFNMLAGKERVDGAQLQVVGALTPAWKITAGYTYLDSKVVKSAPGGPPVGSRLQNTPRNAFTAFTEYRIDPSFEIGGGAVYMSRRYARTTGTPESVPGYWTFNAMAKYSLSPHVDLQLNVYNLANAVYFDQIHPWHVVPGAGRSALLTLTYQD